MKVCTVCGAEYVQDLVRCEVCHALLPEAEVSAPPLQNSRSCAVKICEKCGKENSKTAIRCACGHFLSNNATRVKKTTSQDAEPLLLQVNSGEMLTLMPGEIIGRQYQPKLWDIYTSRAAYRVGFSDGQYMLEDLKASSVVPVAFGKAYRIGRKTMTFQK